MRQQVPMELVVFLALTSLTTLVDAQSRPDSPQSAKAGLPPLVLAEQGSFFVNAQAIETRFPSGNGTPAAGHISGKGMYEAPPNTKADVVVDLDYGVGPPQLSS